MWKKNESHQIVHYYWGESKTQFVRESDSYAHWVMLAPEDGAFRYAIGQEEGEASFGQVVIVPPGLPLWREVSSPALSFHFIEYKWSEQEVPKTAKTKTMPYGAVSIVDKQRLLSTNLDESRGRGTEADRRGDPEGSGVHRGKCGRAAEDGNDRGPVRAKRLAVDAEISVRVPERPSAIFDLRADSQYQGDAHPHRLYDRYDR
ncbi:MAG: transcriptional regulator, AraC family, partial [Paenibacillus sp.]|nr:transcriptional regulator, AraC family [Paenibacillus sp.]